MVLVAAGCQGALEADAPGHAEPGDRVLAGILTEQGRYRVSLVRVGQDFELRLTDASGRPVDNAALLLGAPVQGLVDPGECDSVGEERCLHPDGSYAIRLTRGGEPGTILPLEIDAPAGIDQVLLIAPEP